MGWSLRKRLRTALTFTPTHRQVAMSPDMAAKRPGGVRTCRSPIKGEGIR